jgi:hypothetical protein
MTTAIFHYWCPVRGGRDGSGQVTPGQQSRQNWCWNRPTEHNTSQRDVVLRHAAAAWYAASHDPGPYQEPHFLLEVVMPHDE